jgi:aquaporin Z
MRKYIAEFLGTFFLVLTVGLTVVWPGAGPFAPLAIGCALMIAVYSCGHISGAHVNPAVTLAVWMRGKVPTRDVAPYMVAQLIAGVAAAFLVNWDNGSQVAVTAADPVHIKAVVNEFLFTFMLCWVVLNTATSKKTEGNSYYGLAIGFTVVVGAFAGGTISGGAYNPAVALGVTLMGLSTWSHIWIFLTANFAAGAVAALAYRYINPDEVEKIEKKAA